MCKLFSLSGEERVIRINMFFSKKSFANKNTYMPTHKQILLLYFHLFIIIVSCRSLPPSFPFCFLLFLPLDFVVLVCGAYFITLFFVYPLVTLLHAACIYVHARSLSLLLLLAPKQVQFIYLYLICCHNVLHRYHLVFYTHEKTFTAECFNGFSFFEGVNHRGTKRKIAKHKTMMMMTPIPLSYTHTRLVDRHTHTRVGQSGQCFILMKMMA